MLFYKHVEPQWDPPEMLKAQTWILYISLESKEIMFCYARELQINCGEGLQKGLQNNYNWIGDTNNSRFRHFMIFARERVYVYGF